MLKRLSTIAALLLAASPAAAQRAPDWSGVWRNAANSVHIRAQRCGRAMCGTVIWANAKAKADVARASDAALVGTQLFRNFEYEDGVWYGEVFVPDLGRAFEGTIDLADRNTLVGTGCLFGNFGCREQRWVRVK
ncbi:DUF2147 domain-containing protein [Sphingomonas qomolangmaensis]|uniref:DUF2147 domain-containing protein n=1 Tax=Sphingomonas qomolangmaensis TaxID=2918765 RepID=A0ABY5L6H1_9SPHN|nr:DUF2147 domain-containing protein [Sphingomonas qomolangmaensis]UUL81756.1 DUF2147 domain-containing protein [Sphingomonas qomolangmaensis]